MTWKAARQDRGELRTTLDLWILILLSLPWCDSQLETLLYFSQLLIVRGLFIWIKLNRAIDKETPECV